jgi:multisubunit Na+/H+ antiporter MnhB subunit
VSVLTREISRLLLLPTFVAAIAVLVKGYSDTGDGFSAGVIAATAILLQYLAFGYHEVEARLPVRHAPALAFVGLLLALLVAFGPVFLGDGLLAHMPAPGEHVIHLGSLEFHTAVLFDIGVFLLVLGFSVNTMSLIARAVNWSDQ